MGIVVTAHDPELLKEDGLSTYHQQVDVFVENQLSDYQFFVARHEDTHHTHIHLVASRINLNDGRCVPTYLERYRSQIVCRELEAQNHAAARIAPVIAALWQQAHNDHPQVSYVTLGNYQIRVTPDQQLELWKGSRPLLGWSNGTYQGYGLTEQDCLAIEQHQQSAQTATTTATGAAPVARLNQPKAAKRRQQMEL